MYMVISDVESEFEVLVDRYYDPATDQFLSVDPLVAETGQPYAFTGDDPVNATDSLGNVFGPGAFNFSPTQSVSAKPGPTTAAPAQNPSPQTIEKSALASLTGSSNIPTPLEGCEQRYESSYCESLSTAAQEGLYCGSVSNGVCMEYATDVQAAKAVAGACAGVKGRDAAVYATLGTLYTATLSGFGAAGLVLLILNVTPFGLAADTIATVATVVGFGGFVAGGLAARNGYCSGGSAPEPLSPQERTCSNFTSVIGCPCPLPSLSGWAGLLHGFL
jgi:hypothetical protein